MASQWLSARQTKYAAYATTYILVAIAVVVIILSLIHISEPTRPY